MGGIEECGRGVVWLEGWRCTVGGVEVRSRRGGGVWEGWRCVGGMEVCGRGGVWVGWRCVGGVEECGKGGGVWEEVQVCGKGWSVDGGVEVWWEG